MQVLITYVPNSRTASSANDSTILANVRNDSQDICMAIGMLMRFSPAKCIKCSLVAGLSGRLLLSLGYAGRTSTVSLAIPINTLKNDPNNSLDEILQLRPLSPNASALFQPFQRLSRTPHPSLCQTLLPHCHDSYSQANSQLSARNFQRLLRSTVVLRQAAYTCTPRSCESGITDRNN
jgi:hypothetical protein